VPLTIRRGGVAAGGHFGGLPHLSSDVS
jgi:hypothetical protein